MYDKYIKQRTVILIFQFFKYFAQYVYQIVRHLLAMITGVDHVYIILFNYRGVLLKQPALFLRRRRSKL